MEVGGGSSDVSNKDAVTGYKFQGSGKIHCFFLQLVTCNL